MRTSRWRLASARVNFSRLAFIVTGILAFPNFVLAAQQAYEPPITLNASQICRVNCWPVQIIVSRREFTTTAT